jgi:hypothetical protein
MRTPTELTASDLATRRPVWSAISDLFLDTDTTLFEDDVADVLAASPYSETELAEILAYEVQPVCWPNVFWWEWAGFDLEWLEAQILKRRRRTRLLWFSLPLRSWFNQHSPKWRRIMVAVAKRRAQKTAG